MLEELQILEQLSTDYPEELRLFSKRIRNDFWNDCNDRELSYILHKINLIYAAVLSITDFFDLDLIMEYVSLLSKYCNKISPNLDDEYYYKLKEDIQLENARIIIEKQWMEITVSEDGLKAFKDIFDDVFTNCITIHKDKFFHKLNNTDILCRVVQDKPSNINKDRFIPWDNRTNNRWNPPGKTYLYLSFAETAQQYDDHLSLNEYICLEEFRAKKGEQYYFCDFRPINDGLILDLSYNDVSVRQLQNIIDAHIEDTKTKVLEELMSEPNVLEEYKNGGRKLRRKIKKLQAKHPVSRDVIDESYSKQYLKMVCNCIYKKVDEADEDKKEIAYKSFHLLAQYLEEKGVTGIIYPCTRTKEVIGKNLVLFNKYDAEPIESSIREIIY